MGWKRYRARKEHICRCGKIIEKGEYYWKCGTSTICMECMMSGDKYEEADE